MAYLGCHSSDAIQLLKWCVHCQALFSSFARSLSPCTGTVTPLAKAGGVNTRLGHIRHAFEKNTPHMSKQLFAVLWVMVKFAWK